MMVLAAYGMLIDSSSSLTWIPSITLLLFMTASTIGFLMVPWVMIGELYPSQVKQNYFSLLAL